MLRSLTLKTKNCVWQIRSMCSTLSNNESFPVGFKVYYPLGAIALQVYTVKGSKIKNICHHTKIKCLSGACLWVPTHHLTFAPETARPIALFRIGDIIKFKNEKSGTIVHIRVGKRTRYLVQFNPKSFDFCHESHLQPNPFVPEHC